MRGDDGFTLVEVLVALSLMALGILLFIQTSLTLLGLSDRSRKMTEALCVAQDRMELLKAGGWTAAVADCDPEPTDPSRYSRELSRRGRRYRLVLEKRERRTGLDRFIVTCFWESGRGLFDHSRSVRVDTLRSRRP